MSDRSTADILRTGPSLAEAFAGHPVYARALVDAPTLLDYANNPSPLGLARVFALAGRVLAEQTTPTRDDDVSLGIMPGLPNPMNLPLTKVMRGGRPTRVYHGTPEAFRDFDPTKADRDALYGPGFYFTENPKTAHGYATKFWTDEARDADRGLANVLGMKAYHQEILEKGRLDRPWDVKRLPLEPDEIAYHRSQIQGIQPMIDRETRRLTEKIADYSGSGAANVRPVYLDITRPLNIEATYSAKEVLRRADRGRNPYGGDDAAWRSLIQDEVMSAATDPAGKITGGSLYRALTEVFGSKAKANLSLQGLGFDGITHIGGMRAPGRAAGHGAHKVWIGFGPEQIVDPFAYQATTGLGRAFP